jgi:hypothetical protein
MFQHSPFPLDSTVHHIHIPNSIVRLYIGSDPLPASFTLKRAVAMNVKTEQLEDIVKDENKIPCRKVHSCTVCQYGVIIMLMILLYSN